MQILHIDLDFDHPPVSEYSQLDHRFQSLRNFRRMRVERAFEVLEMVAQLAVDRNEYIAGLQFAISRSQRNHMPHRKQTRKFEPFTDFPHLFLDFAR